MVKDLKSTHCNNVTFKRDLMRQSHVTLNMTLLNISGSSEAEAMTFLCFAGFLC